MTAALTRRRPRPSGGRIALWTFNTLVVAFLLAPIVIVVITSFSSAAVLSFPPPGWSTQWYTRFFENSDFTSSLTLSLRLAAIAALVSTLIGLLAAMALELGRVRGGVSFRALFIAPLAVPAVVAGLGMLILFSRIGVAGTMLGLVLAHVVIVLPFTLIIIASGLRTFDVTVIEAARSLGATWPRTAVTVILPMIRGA